MKKKKHLHTRFIKFLIEKHLEDPDVNEPLPDEETEELRLKQKQKEFDEEEEPQQDGTDDSDGIDQLVNEYKKLRRQYESHRIYNRGR
jgi:hypothetical protein